MFKLTSAAVAIFALAFVVEVTVADTAYGANGNLQASPGAVWYKHVADGTVSSSSSVQVATGGAGTSDNSLLNADGDNTFASVGASSTSGFLQAGAFGFSIPTDPNVIVTGVQIDIVRSATKADASATGTIAVRTNNLYLRLSADSSNPPFFTFAEINDFALNPNYPTTTSGLSTKTVTYGGPTYQWKNSTGGVITKEILNNPKFLVQIQAQNTGTATANVYIDQIRITVYYSKQAVRTVSLSGQSAASPSLASWSTDTTGGLVPTSNPNFVDTAVQTAGDGQKVFINNLAAGSSSTRYFFAANAPTVPSGSTILGVEIDLIASAQAGFKFSNVQIGVNRNPVGTNLCANPANCPLPTAYPTTPIKYGGPRETFAQGSSLTADFVNQATFGGTFTGTNTGTGTATVNLDQIQMIIYYV